MPTLNQPTYLDYNATAPTSNAAKLAITEALDRLGNPSSIHGPGRAARSLIEEAREHVAALAASSQAHVIFTSGATEANALAISAGRSAGRVSRVLCSAIEHPSILENLPSDARIPVTPDGCINLDDLEAQLSADGSPALVCVMAANNETGVIQPIEHVANLVHAYDGYLLCDMAQVPGKLDPLNFVPHADLITLSAHKFGGPMGVGALINYRDLQLQPLFAGGGQERKVRSGTENVAGIVGFGAAAREVLGHSEREPMRTLRDRLETALKAARQDAVIFGQDVERLPNTTCVALPGSGSQQQLIKLDLAGFAVSAGSACSSGKVSASHVLLAMGVSPDIAKCSLRISIGPDTRWSDLERFVEVWAKA